MRRLIKLTYHDGTAEQVVFFRADYHSTVTIVIHFLSVHGLETGQSVSVDVSGMTHEWSYDDISEMRQTLLEVW
jgi:hypothetical protein